MVCGAYYNVKMCLVERPKWLKGTWKNHLLQNSFLLSSMFIILKSPTLELLECKYKQQKVFSAFAVDTNGEQIYV